MSGMQSGKRVGSTSASKLPYQAPTAHLLGSLQALTQSGASAATNDAGNNMMSA